MPGAEVIITSDPVARFLARVEAKPAGPGKWTARCPAHEDNRASLSIARGETGALLLTCFAGCEFKRILQAAGMQPGEAFPAKPNGNGHHRKPESRPPQRFAFPADAAAAVARGKGGEVEKLFRWSDEWYRARIRTGSGKTFVEITEDGDGWILRGPAKPHTLYRVADLPRTGPVFVCEGEKACEAGWRINLPCTTSGGAISAGAADWTPLAGRDVVILPDNDTPGLKYAIAVRDALAALSPPARVRILQLPGLPDGGDLVEFIDARDTRDDDEIRGEIEALAKATRVENAATARASIVTLSAVERQAAEWLWTYHVPRRAITIIAGRPGAGKSLCAISLAAAVTTGSAWPLEVGKRQPADVVLVLGEDDLGTTVRPRFESAGGDVSRVRVLQSVRADDGREFMFHTRRDADVLSAMIAERPTDLVVIDPLAMFLGGADSHKHSDTYNALSPLAKLAQETGVAILAVHHSNKGRNETGLALEKLMGAQAFGAVARSAWLVFDDPEDQTGETKLLAHAKATLSRLQPALQFNIAEDQTGVAYIHWLGRVGKTADELQREVNAAGGQTGGALAEACDWLKENLGPTPIPANELVEKAKAADISQSTLKRARTKLGVKAMQTRDGDRIGGWAWWLPDRVTA